MRFAYVLLVALLISAMGLAEAATAGGPWRELHRPLDLPEVAPGEACPVSPVDQRVDWAPINIFGVSGIGRGPVYPGLGRKGRLRATSGPNGEGWFSGKVFWYVKPSYGERVLIRGRRLDGPGSLRFIDVDDGGRGRKLRIKRKTDVTWHGQPEGSRGEPSGVLFRESGCYGVQIDGTRFSRTVVFRASTVS